MLKIRRSPLWIIGAGLPLALVVTALLAAGRTEARNAATLTPPVLFAAGDVASCKWDGDEETAALIQSRPGFVAMLGDAVYPEGSADNFARCYAPSWGQFADRTFPAAGNHEYVPAPGRPATTQEQASPYFEYFGRRAGPIQRGYFGYRLGSWNIVVLNDNCAAVGGCGSGSPEELWLRRELRTFPTLCTLAYWHKPRFSGGEEGSETLAFWRDLYSAGADLILNGHAHSYERFAPQRPSGSIDRRFGIREFVVGTGGAPLGPFARRLPNTETRDSTSLGILRLDLGRGSYRWRFIPVPGATFQDSGRGTCHRAPVTRTR